MVCNISHVLQPLCFEHNKHTGHPSQYAPAAPAANHHLKRVVHPPERCPNPGYKAGNKTHEIIPPHTASAILCAPSHLPLKQSPSPAISKQVCQSSTCCRPCGRRGKGLRQRQAVAARHPAAEVQEGRASPHETLGDAQVGRCEGAGGSSLGQV